MLLFFLFGSFFAPNDPTAANIRDKFLSSSTEYPFGTDDFGRCEFSRILEGGKTTLGIVLTGSAIVIILGIFFGILLAKTGRRRNILAESILNAVTAIPPVAYLIIFIGIWGNSIPTMLVALTASLILRMIKLVKTLIEVEYGKAYIMCAIACGAGKARIMPHCWFAAMMAQMPEDVSIPLLDNSEEFISALSEFKTCNDDARLRELFELLINTDLDQVLDVPLTHQMDMIVYNTDKIADYNFASDYAFLDVTQITPVE